MHFLVAAVMVGIQRKVVMKNVDFAILADAICYYGQASVFVLSMLCRACIMFYVAVGTQTSVFDSGVIPCGIKYHIYHREGW